jgi:hypothetical protein
MERRFWVGLTGGMALVLVLAFVLIRRSSRRADDNASVIPPAAASVQSARSPAPNGPTADPAAQAREPAGAPSAAASIPATRRSPLPTVRKRIELQDIDDPLEAVEIVNLRRGAGDTIEVGARNLSRRGVLVKSVDIFAESDDRVPLCNIGFWLPVGGAAEDRREVPELSRRLGEKEGIKAVINEAEFRDAPPDELAK